MADLKEFIPQNKFDIKRAESAIALGYPAVEPILPELISWLQDLNWPVAIVLAPFLSSIGSPVIPHVQTVMQTDDHIWKYGMMVVLMRDSHDVALAFREELRRIAYAPSNQEVVEGLQEMAQDILEKYRWHRAA